MRTEIQKNDLKSLKEEFNNYKHLQFIQYGDLRASYGDLSTEVTFDIIDQELILKVKHPVRYTTLFLLEKSLGAIEKISTYFLDSDSQTNDNPTKVISIKPYNSEKINFFYY